MPLGILDDTEFERELERLKNNSKLESENPRARIEIIKSGRGNKRETPESLRKVIADESLKGTESKELQKLFNVSSSSVSAYKNGATSTATYNKPDEDLAQFVDEKRAEISKEARSKLMSALSAITPDKLDNAKLQVASQVAKDMSAIIKNMEPRADQINGPQVQFTFYAPPMKNPEDFPIKVIDAN